VVGLRHRARLAAAVAAAVTAVPLASAALTPASASAAVLRTATTTSYTTANYLQDALGLPITDTNPVIAPVTYDEFQWVLQQSGKSAILIGDPATDSNFAARARDVEAAAKAAGVKEVYWFDPNLSGNAKVGSTTEPNLDIRNSADITVLSAASQTTYGNAWLLLASEYLGDGVAVTQTGVNTESAKVTASSTGDQTGYTDNDYGYIPGYSTKIANGAADTSGGALYDYSSDTGYPTTIPTTATDSYFFIYDKGGTVTDASSDPENQNILNWIDLDGESSSANTQADVTTAVTNAGGASDLTGFSQFDWWESEANARQLSVSTSPALGSNVPLLSASDNGGWKIDQVTYPEIVDLLKSGDTASADAVILFGGTWCPNTRPVLPFVNDYAQQNNVTVFNFDTVLDGGSVGGSTTSASNPLQTRNTAASSSSTNANPSFLYGDLVNTYLKNMETQYGPVVTYYPGGDNSGTLTTAQKLQVPFLIGYENNGGNGVTRQWIIDNGDGTYTEYMSQWWFTNPQPNELGLSSSKLPADAPIWPTINSELANVTYATNPASIDPNTAIDTDDAQYLDSADTATVALTGTAPAVTAVSVTATGSTSISPADLSGALSALGSSAPANYAAAKTALIAAENATTPDPTLVGNLTTVVGAWGVAQSRKTNVITAWGNATTPASVLGGLAADHALDVFFAGLPPVPSTPISSTPVASKQTVTANPVTYGTTPKITVAVTDANGYSPSGNVSLLVQNGGKTVASQSAAVVNGSVSFTLPKLAPGTYHFTVSYAGDTQVPAFSDSGTLRVAKARVKKVAGKVSKAQTKKARGKYKVTVTKPNGDATATGTVKIKLTKGKTTKTLSGKLSRGSKTFTLPKLAKGTWKVKISFAGSSNYVAGTANGTKIKVKVKIK